MQRSVTAIFSPTCLKLTSGNYSLAGMANSFPYQTHSQPGSYMCQWCSDSAWHGLLPVLAITTGLDSLTSPSQLIIPTLANGCYSLTLLKLSTPLIPMHTRACSYLACVIHTLSWVVRLGLAQPNLCHHPRPNHPTHAKERCYPDWPDPPQPQLLCPLAGAAA